MKNCSKSPTAQRLINEWREHGKIIIAYDYDDTISPWKLNNQEFCDSIIKRSAHAREIGVYNIIFTACLPERFDEITNYCTTKGIKVDAINKNAFPLPYGNHGKIYYNILLDDRAGLEQALDELEYVSWVISSEKHHSSEQTVEF